MSCSLLLQSEITQLKSSAGPTRVVATPSPQTGNDRNQMLPSAILKSVGSIENFWGSHEVVRRVLFDNCMGILWNAVFYDSVRDYLSSWRKRKLWSGNCVSSRPVREICKYVKVAEEEKILDETVSYWHKKNLHFGSLFTML